MQVQMTAQKISEAASKITEEKFNTKIEVTRVGFGSYDQQVNLTLASSEKLDLMYEYCGNVTSAISSGQILRLRIIWTAMAAI